MDAAQPRSRRPSPDALLAEARRDGEGRLKVFLGAAPGVGKTWEMLTAARTKARTGIDVVAGIIETHGRSETAALIEGLDVLPRRRSNHHDREEFDLDALLARRPQLALIDELAHTNAPDSRHPKRWQDVEEILAAGIDVYTTLNVQHIESLNDIVAQITRIRVRETVPDHIIDRADDIEVIDLTSDDLIARLRDGKVYVRATAERALRHYFSRGNLTALRELALRQAAKRVDDQLLAHMQTHAIAGPWGAGDRILVCVSDDAHGAGLVRYAKRLADRLHAPWIAATVDNPKRRSTSESQRNRLSQALRVATRLGGTALTIPGSGRIADDVLGYAHDHNITQIVVGKTARSRWFELLNGSVVHDLVRRSGNISVHVISDDAQPDQAAPPRAARLREERARHYLAALALVGLALCAAWALQPVFGLEAVDLIFLTAVVIAAVQLGLASSLLAVATSSLAYNFFFLPPIYTFTITDPTNIASFVLFMVVALLVSNVAARSRAQAAIARDRANTTEALYAFGRKLASCTGLDDVLWATAYQIAFLLRVRVVVLLPDDTGTIDVRAGHPPEDMLDAADIAAAKVTFDKGAPAGRGSDTLPGARRLFVPIRTSRGIVGVVGLDSDTPGPILSPEQMRLFDALGDHAALAIQQVQLLADLDRAKVDAKANRLRQALLTSISHDLRTPLAAIVGSAGTLRDFDDKLDTATKHDLLRTIQDESDRLNRFIANLLDMTRLEAGAVAPNRSPHDVSELVGSTVRRAQRILAHHRLVVSLEPDLPMIDVDPILFEQALFNVLDNAAKYSRLDSRIEFHAQKDVGNIVRVEIRDEGDGIASEDLSRIFDKFNRASKGDRVRPGTGLGLSICRGFIEAMGGTIVAQNRTDRKGAVFVLTAPVSRDNAVEDAA